MHYNFLRFWLSVCIIILLIKVCVYHAVHRIKLSSNLISWCQQKFHLETFLQLVQEQSSFKVHRSFKSQYKRHYEAMQMLHQRPCLQLSTFFKTLRTLASESYAKCSHYFLDPITIKVPTHSDNHACNDSGCRPEPTVIQCLLTGTS